MISILLTILIVLTIITFLLTLFLIGQQYNIFSIINSHTLLLSIFNQNLTLLIQKLDTLDDNSMDDDSIPNFPESSLGDASPITPLTTSEFEELKKLFSKTDEPIDDDEEVV